jgi:hypothetical protein
LIRGRRIASFAIAFSLVTAGFASGRGLAAAPTLSSCLANKIVRLTGTYSSNYRSKSPAAGTTFDARGAKFTAYPAGSTYPFSVGKYSAPRRLCVIGGLVVGSQSRGLTWDQMKNAYHGAGLRIGGNNWYVVDGLRVDNVEDGISPRGTEDRYPKDGDGFVLRNIYMTYIRDDCVENDDIAGGLIEDSLFDGCYTGISERPASGSPQLAHRAPAAEQLVMNRVLMRMQAQPGPHGTNNPKLLGHGKPFKWSDVANKVVIKDSIILLERQPNGGSWTPFPDGTRAERVTIVWRGAGPFKWKVPAGVKVTTDKSVWDRARAKWLSRHGCSSFASCSRLHTPLPY